MREHERDRPRKGRAPSAILVAATLALGCVPIEVRGGRSAIESEAASDGAIVVCGADGDASREPRDASREPRDASAGAGDAAAASGPPPTSGFRLEATPPRAEVLRGSRVTFEVRVVRAPGFVLPIVIQAFGLPPGSAAEPVAAADLPAALVVTAEGLAPESALTPFAIHGSAAGYRATLRAEIAVTGPPIIEE